MRHYIIYTVCMLCTIYSAGAQNCHLDKENWDRVEQNSTLSSTQKSNIRSAITTFIDHYNKYADLYDEEGQMFTENDFLALLNTKSASSDYLNDILQSPTVSPAADYIQMAYDYFPNGYGYCLHGIDVKEIRQLQSDFFSIRVEVLKRGDVYLDLNNSVTNKPRELSITFTLAVLKNEEGESEARIIDSKLIGISNIKPDLAVSDKNKPRQQEEEGLDMTIAEQETPKSTSRRNGNRERDSNRLGDQPKGAVKSYAKNSYSLGYDKRPSTTYNMLYAEGGYGFPAFHTASNVKSTVGEVNSGYNLGLGYEYWKSMSSRNKYFMTMGVMLRYHNLSSGADTVNMAFTPKLNPGRASKNQKSDLFGLKIQQDIITAYVPIGFAYNSKAGKAVNMFMLQGAIMPGFTIFANRKATGSGLYQASYDDNNSCEIKILQLAKLDEFSTKSGFTLAARISPQYVWERRGSKDGQSGFGIVLGADLNIGIMKLASATNENFVQEGENKLSSIAPASILHDYVSYHSIGIRVGLYFVKY